MNVGVGPLSMRIGLILKYVHESRISTRPQRASYKSSCQHLDDYMCAVILYFPQAVKVQVKEHSGSGVEVIVSLSEGSMQSIPL